MSEKEEKKKQSEKNPTYKKGLFHDVKYINNNLNDTGFLNVCILQRHALLHDGELLEEATDAVEKIKKQVIGSPSDNLIHEDFIDLLKELFLIISIFGADGADAYKIFSRSINPEMTKITEMTENICKVVFTEKNFEQLKIIQRFSTKYEGYDALSLTTFEGIDSIKNIDLFEIMNSCEKNDLIERIDSIEEGINSIEIIESIQYIESIEAIKNIDPIKKNELIDSIENIDLIKKNGLIDLFKNIDPIKKNELIDLIENINSIYRFLSIVFTLKTHHHEYDNASKRAEEKLKKLKKLLNEKELKELNENQIKQIEKVLELKNDSPLRKLEKISIIVNEIEKKIRKKEKVSDRTKKVFDKLKEKSIGYLSVSHILPTCYHESKIIAHCTTPLNFNIIAIPSPIIDKV